MTNLEVKDMAASHCKYWGKKLKTIPKSSNLSASRWAKLGGIVRSMAGDLRGLPKAQALSLIRTRTGCSEEIMDNMNGIHHLKEKRKFQYSPRGGFHVAAVGMDRPACAGYFPLTLILLILPGIYAAQQ